MENIVKQGRAKGLGVVMVTQSIKDLGKTLTQANLRILLKILESEIQFYGTRFGLDLARALHGLNPKERIGYIFYSGQEFWCKFRPTLSMPKGLESKEKIRKHVEEEKRIEVFNEQFEEVKEVKRVERKGVTKLSEDEERVMEVLREFKREGINPSKNMVMKRVGFGRQKTLNILDRLKEMGLIEIVEVKGRGHPKVVRLVRK